MWKQSTVSSIQSTRWLQACQAVPQQVDSEETKLDHRLTSPVTLLPKSHTSFLSGVHKPEATGHFQQDTEV